MYLKITNNLIDLVCSGDSNASMVLEYVELSMKLGKHFVFGDIEVLERITSLDQDLPYLKSLHSMYSELGLITETFIWHVEFCDSNTKSYKDDDNHIIYVTMDAIPSFEIYQECHLLCENLNDIRLFEYILARYKRKHNYSKVATNHYPLLGGGVTTADVLKNEILRNKNFVLCITDSDFKYRNVVEDNCHNTSALGDTAKAVLKQYKKLNYFGANFYHYQNVSELENLIPFSILKEYVLENIKDKTDTIAFFKKIYDTDKNLLSFIDYKKGVSLKRLQGLNEHDDIENILRIIYPNIGDVVADDISRREEIGSILLDIKDKMSETKPDVIDTLGRSINDFLKEWSGRIKYLEGLGDKIMDHILDYLDDNNLESFIAAELSEDQEIEYEAIGSLMYSWTCAQSPVALFGA